ncbi:hypothetical protein L2E82_08857 [Cichorium intybus]|uniref:Uncharacterized protein n=1 Tax=Cichorium intybus TaxID=13427 RepID=A0ACB9G746_CICIN|nr:hypothetical protein L2E82_08857 [Cichorium intybus]
MGYLDLVISSTNPNLLACVVYQSTRGGFNQNSKFSYGHTISPIKRSLMEDFYDTRIDYVNGETLSFFGVFDADGGARAIGISERETGGTRQRNGGCVVPVVSIGGGEVRDEWRG